jgi:hypothetical protein
MKIGIAMFPPIPIPLSRGRVRLRPCGAPCGDHKQDAGQSGGRNDDKREPNGHAARRPAKAAGSGQFSEPETSGTTAARRVPLNISRMVAMAPHGGTRDTPWSVQVAAGTVMVGASAQSTDITACQPSPNSSGRRRPTASGN